MKQSAKEVIQGTAQESPKRKRTRETGTAIKEIFQGEAEKIVKKVVVEEDEVTKLKRRIKELEEELKKYKEKENH